MCALPVWSRNLQNYYVVIRIDGRNKTVRRRWYRKVEKEKLRLAELGIHQPHIIAVARYLSNLKDSSCERLQMSLEAPVAQLPLIY